MLTPRLAEENRAFPFADYFVAPSRRLVCAAIPKSGCSDLKHWFMSLVEPEKLADPSLRLHAYCRATHTLARFGPAERAELLRDSFTLALVRDPLSRVVSAYVEKFVRPAPHELFEPAREVVAEVAPARGDGVSFREFVRYLEEAPDEHLDPHWRPQSSFINGVRIDLVGRMDSLTVILDALGRELGMPPRSGSKRNSTGYTPARGERLADVASARLHERGLLPPASDLYDDDLRERVLARFQRDAALYERANEHVPDETLERLRRARDSSQHTAGTRALM